MTNVVPFEKPLTAKQMLQKLSADTANIALLPHGQKRAKSRMITRRQIELCIQKGVIIEGPFTNDHGNFQLTLQRAAAGEQITCVVAIDWPTRILVITAYY